MSRTIREGVERLEDHPGPPMGVTPAHSCIRVGLTSAQWCTTGTKNDLARHILLHLADTLGEYMFRYSTEEIEACLSDPVTCESDPGRHHYVFDSGNLSYLP